MLNRLKNLNIFLLLLVILSINSLREINIAQSLVVLGLLGILAYNKYMEHIKKPDISGDIRQELEHLKNKVSSIAVKDLAKTERPNEIKRFF